jgi:hypothetical protein
VCACVLLELAEGELGRERERQWCGVCVWVSVGVERSGQLGIRRLAMSYRPGRFCRGAADPVRECGELMHTAEADKSRWRL